MLDQHEQSLLHLFDKASCAIIQSIDLDNRNTVLYLDMNIDIDRFENGYWGREYSDGYQYKTYRI